MDHHDDVKPGSDPELSTLPEENPNPTLRVDHEARILYANSAAARAMGLTTEKTSSLPKELARVVRQSAETGEPLKAQTDSGTRTYVFSIVPVHGKSYVNLYGHDATDTIAAQRQVLDLARFPDENPNPVLRISLDGTLLFANEGAKKIKGLLSKGGDQLATDLKLAIEETYATNASRVVELVLNGRRFAFSMTPIETAGYINAYGRDITEQWQAQQRANDLAKFPDENPNPVLRVEADGMTLYANRPAGQLPGLLTHGGTRLAEVLITAAAVRAHREEICVTDFVSGKRTFAMTIMPVSGESYLNVYGRDVTKERQAQNDMLQIKRFNEDVLNTLTNGIMTLDSQLHVTSTNPAIRSFLGVPDRSFEGEALAAILGSNKWLMELVQEGLLGSEARIVVDKELVSFDGTPRSVNLTMATFREGSGSDSGLILALEDISREKRVKGTMVRFMSDKVVERLLNLDESALAGTSQEVSVLFSDIRGFTGLSERHGAQEMVRILNTYFSAMVDVVFDNGGTLDKFIGDAIMAVFGAPFQSIDDTENSVTTAVEMLRRLRPFNAARKLEGFQSIDIGIGIDTGPVIAGTIGSSRRMDYTVIGEHVNRASRIEGVNKIYGTHILVSEHTHEKLMNEHITREVDLVRVSGVDLPVRIFEILDYHTEESFPHMEKVIEVFAEGLDAYRNQHWRGAAAAFAEGLKLNPNDRPTQIFLSRCWNYMARLPDKAWSGITDLEK
jgi:class 3 adenylate cyclase